MRLIMAACPGTKDGKLTHDLTRFPHGMPWLIEQASTTC